MSHKVHPKIFRIEQTSDWDSRWLTKKNFSQYLEEDFCIRKYLERVLRGAGLEKIEIERFPNKINIIIESSRPGLIIGRRGGGVEKLNKDLMKLIRSSGKTKKEIKIDIREIRNPWTRAGLAAQWIASQLEKRFPHRRALKQALGKIMACKEVRGARVEVSGRLGGVEIARREFLKQGQLPRQTIRASIDYAQAKARCSYGVIGVKVWIYKGEKFT